MVTKNCELGLWKFMFQYINYHISKYIIIKRRVDVNLFTCGVSNDMLVNLEILDYWLRELLFVY